MGRSQPAAFSPDPANAAAYEKLYAEYRTLHDYFGRGGNEVMHRLRELRRRAYTDGFAGAEEDEVEAAAREEVTT